MLFAMIYNTYKDGSKIMKNTEGFVIYVSDPTRMNDAEELSARTGAPVTRDPGAAEAAEVCLVFDAGGAALRGNGMELRGDLAHMTKRLVPRNLNGEMLVRAAKPKSFGEAPTALDATAGLGEDSILLAAAGFKVTLCERDPVIACLLRDALARAAEAPELADAVSGMTLIECDSVRYMRSLERAPDVIYLDPMFPERRKSGLIRKKLQLLQMLEAPCDDEELLLRAAIDAAPAKIIIKRPAKGGFLAGVKPGYSITGKAVRYDCIVPPQTGR